MANTPTHAAQPPRPPQQPPKPTPQPPPRPSNPTPSAAQHPAPVAGVAPPEPGLAIGARPKDGRDPQSAKFEAQAAPPHWQEPKPPETIRETFVPKFDGMGAADEQRARSAWIEQQGMKKYLEEIDQRPPEERTNTQVQGVVPPTKRG